jgi:hypothetical protein
MRLSSVLFAIAATTSAATIGIPPAIERRVNTTWLLTGVATRPGLNDALIRHGLSAIDMPLEQLQRALF